MFRSDRDAGLAERDPSSIGDTAAQALPSPSASVVIPTRDRPAELERCLHALSRSRTRRSLFEVVIVDDGSRTSPSPIFRRFEGQLELRMLRQPASGPARARNLGAAHARGALLVFLDDDCEPSPAWLDEVLAQHQAWPDAAIGGGVRNSLYGNPYSEASHALIEYLYDRANPEPTNGRFLASLNLALPRREFLALGGFDPSYPMAAGEDRDLCRRWREAGHRLVYAADAWVAHGHALDLGRFLRQHYRYGKGARRFHRAPPGKSSRVRAGFYVGLILFPLRGGWSTASVRTSALLALAQGATFAGYLHETLGFRSTTRVRP